MKVIQGRLNGIDALRRLYKDVDFKNPNNEGKLHALFETCPWLIDPTFTQFLTSDQTENELNIRLSKHLEIGNHVPSSYDPKNSEEAEPLKKNKRPDLVFLISNKSLKRVVIVELKAPNTPLHNGHLDQLKGYIGRTEKWLREQGGDKSGYKVEGYLIGE